MILHREACHEIIQFLESFENETPCLPDSISDHWLRVIQICRSLEPDWHQATNLCDRIAIVLNRLGRGDRSLRQFERAEGQVSILLGAVHLGKEDWHSANYYFEQAARRLKHWGDSAVEGLAYFGQALTYRQENNWPKALEVAQRGREVICHLPIRDQSAQTRELDERIKKEVESITAASIEDAARTSAAERSATWQCRPCHTIGIPIVSDIAVGINTITDQSVIECVYLDEDHYNSADFAVRMVDNTMKGNGILRGDIVLIRQQETAEEGEISAIVITTRKGLIGVLKEYHQAYQEPADMRHWFLKSSSPSSEHLVIISSGSNVDAIKALYQKAAETGSIRNPIKYCENSELTIIGKYVGLVRQIL